MAEEEVTLTLEDHWQLAVRSAMGKETSEVAHRIAEEAKAIAQEQGHVLSGDYINGIVVDEPDERSFGTARVKATDQKSSWMEFGNYQHPGYFILRTAANRLGFKWYKKEK